MPNDVGFYGLFAAVGVAPAVVVVGWPGIRLMARVASAAVLVRLSFGTLRQVVAWRFHWWLTGGDGFFVCFGRHRRKGLHCLIWAL